MRKRKSVGLAVPSVQSVKDLSSVQLWQNLLKVQDTLYFGSDLDTLKASLDLDQLHTVLGRELQKGAPCNTPEKRTLAQTVYSLAGEVAYRKGFAAIDQETLQDQLAHWAKARASTGQLGVTHWILKRLR